MKELLFYTWRKVVDYWTRIKTFPRCLLGGAVLILVAVFGGRAIELLIIQLTRGAIPQDYAGIFDASDKAKVWILGICSIMIVTAILMAVSEIRNRSKRESRKRVIVIEGRGLRDDSGSPLIDAVDPTIDGQRIPVLLDLRQKLDGKIVSPETLLEKILVMQGSLQQHKDAVDRADLTVVYAGLTSVPFTFLTGVLIDDEGSVVTMDWDRTREGWRSLDGPDDDKAFVLEHIEQLDQQDEVVLAVSCSYPIKDTDIQSAFSAPIVKLTLDGASSDAHWSEDKQSRLATQFLETVKQLDRKGIKTIHLVLAAPNSMVFNLGRRYDKRNLPDIVVYQFERDQSPAYPWGVKMPVAANRSAKMV